MLFVLGRIPLTRFRPTDEKSVRRWSTAGGADATLRPPSDRLTSYSRITQSTTRVFCALLNLLRHRNDPFISVVVIDVSLCYL